jgi:hypothetical protein
MLVSNASLSGKRSSVGGNRYGFHLMINHDKPKCINIEESLPGFCCRIWFMASATAKRNAAECPPATEHLKTVRVKPLHHASSCMMPCPNVEIS